MNPKCLTVFLFLTTSGLLACQSGTVDIGDETTSLADYAGSWEGHAELHTFPGSSSDRVALTLTATGEGAMEFGDAPLYPPPTDPNVGYPVPADDPSFTIGTRIRAGFRYPIHETIFDRGRLRLALNQYEPFDPWCALQTPHPIPGTDQFSCIDYPMWGQFTETVVGSTCTATWADGTTFSYDCGQSATCGTCQCDVSGCRAYSFSNAISYIVLLDAMFDDGGSKLTGTLQLDSQLHVTVRLQRR